MNAILTEGLFDGTLDGLIDILGFTEGWNEGNLLIVGLKEGILDGSKEGEDFESRFGN